MTFPGFLAALEAGDLIIVRGDGEGPLHVPAHALRHGRPDVLPSKLGKSRKQVSALISFREEGKKK